MIIGVGDYKSPQWIREQIASVRKLGLQLPEGYEVVHAGAREYFLDLATIAKNSATEVVPLDHPLLAVLGQAFEDIISTVINGKSNASYLRAEFTDQTKYRQRVERDFLMLLGESDDPRQIQKALQQMVPPAEYQVYETALRILEIGCGVAGLRHMEQKLQDARRKYMAELILREGPSLVIVDARHAQPLEKLVSGYEARLL
ncbi:hypothetical protein HY497_02130 [Candidatus Woesearchaeota archaeon]|nr:hypothetical protein [Candidatus Woesearchaeota archaeon]